MGRLGDERVVPGARIQRQVGNDEEVGNRQRMGADRLADRSFAGVEPDPRLEPLAVIGDETDQRHRRLARALRDENNIVELGLWRSVEDAVGRESVEPCRCIEHGEPWLYTLLR